MGDDVVNGMEQSVKGRLQQVQGIAQSSAKIAGQDPTAWTDQTLTPNEKRILAGQPFRPNAAAGAASTITPGGKLVDIPGRGRGYILPGGMFQPVSQ
jgi:hypothetical protein